MPGLLVEATECTTLQQQVYKNGLKNVLTLYMNSAESKLAFFGEHSPTIAQTRSQLQKMSLLDTIYFFDR